MERLECVVKNHTEILDLWEWSLTNVKGTEMKRRIIGVNFVMKKLDFYFGSCLGKVVIKQTDYTSVFY